MTRIWIQVCESNPLARRDDLLAPLRAQTEDFHVACLTCLDRCTQCSRQPFALINGRIYTASSCEELVGRVMLLQRHL